MRLLKLLNSYFNLDKSFWDGSNPSQKIVYTPILAQLLLYLGVLAGVGLSSELQALNGLRVPESKLLISAVIALMLMPTAFEKMHTKNAPFLAKMGLMIQTGVFWNTLVSLT